MIGRTSGCTVIYVHPKVLPISKFYILFKWKEEKMKEFTFEKKESTWALLNNNETILTIRSVDNAQDSFTEIEPGAWLWERHTEVPVEQMRMEFDTAYKAEYTMIPGVSYNGNGWGDSPEYVGQTYNGIPWTFAWHRCMIPACTYSEGQKWAAALMGEADDEMSCSQWTVEENTRHALIWPEQEGPRILMRHYWSDDAFMGKMEPRSDFKAIITVFPVKLPRKQSRTLMDFAWRYYAHPLKASMEPEQLYKYSIAYIKSLWTQEKSGFVAFNRGFQWYTNTCSYGKRNEIQYEIGWVGQNASISNALLWEYLSSGDRDALDKALSVLDSWIKYAKLPNGLMLIKFDGAPQTTPEEVPLKSDDTNGDQAEEKADTTYMPEVARYIGGVREFQIDACNLGGAAQHYFEAYKLAEQAGCPRPEYYKLALDICDFAVRVQKQDGALAKSWNRDGSISREGGTIGCFLVPPLLTAYQITGEEKYLTSAKRAFDFYYKDIEEYGFTTAGALDTYCIDKESSSPLFSAALSLYRVTQEKHYVEKAENIAWYLSTWMMHYTVKYSKETVLREIGYDTMGMTGVSTAHNAIDQYALHDVMSFMELAELTGNKQWHERAMAIWCSTTQLFSDGTLCIAGRVRPAGSQDEAVYHTRWARPTLGPYNPTQWLVAWPCAFRMEILRYMPDWSIFKNGLSKIEGKIEN